MSLNTYHRVLEEHSAHKRFNERWVADPVFRKELAEDAAGTLARYQIPCSPEDIRTVLTGDLSNLSPAMRAMWQIVQAKSQWVQQFYWKEAVPTEPRLRAWRERQIARQLLDLGPFHTRSNIHASLSIELTKGCSVGCWFCALSPGRLGGVLRHDAPNQELWRGVLRVLRECLGPAAKTGFLYWATDPLDNPDYEKFCVDFHEEIGVFPPTTTALALKDPARTRSLLKTSVERGCWLNRFSILNLKLLSAVHAEFSPSELAQVECLPLNRESAFAFGNAGRFRERVKSEPELMQQQKKNLRWAPWYTGDPAYANTEDYPLASIGCVTGFLLNMCERSVQLISPCTSSDRWPLGYYVYDQGTFDTPQELASLLARMIDRNMSPAVRATDRLRFLDLLRYEALEDGFQVTGRFKGRVSFQEQGAGSAWRVVGESIHRGDLTAGEVVQTVASRCGSAPDAVRALLDKVLQAGVLDEVRV